MTSLQDSPVVFNARLNIAAARKKLAQVIADRRPALEVSSAIAGHTAARQALERSILATLARQDAERPAFEQAERERRGCIRLVADVLAAG